MRVDFAGVEQATTRLLHEAGSDAVLSFDVFDTLLHRRCSKDFVKSYVARRLEEELVDRGVVLTTNIAESRRQVESALFDEAAARGMDPEFHIAARNLRWVDRLAGDQLDKAAIEELAAWAEAVEVDAEIATAVPNVEMRSAVTRLRTRAPRLVFASDMYLGAANVSTILEAHGFNGLFDGGYVSGDLELYKATGRMFEHIARSEGVPTSLIVHVGDNAAADLEGPVSVGSRAVLIDDPSLIARRARDETEFAAVAGDSRFLPLVIDRFVHEGLGGIRSFAESYGRSLFGPIFSDFVHEVAVRADDAGVSALFFLSRDGFTFRRMYEAMGQTDWVRSTPRIPSRYIGLSRLPVLRAMLQDGMSLKALLSAKNHLVPSSRSVTNTFASLGLDPVMVAALARRHGVDPAGFFHDGLLHWPPFLNLLTDRELAAEARRVGNGAAELVRDYLRQEGFFDFDRVGLVDIGWGATIQDQLRDCIMNEPDCPTMVGYYFGGNASMFERRTPDNWMDAVSASVFTSDDVLALGNAATFSFVGLMEEAARAPHGTCVGYERRGDEVVPILRPDAARRAEVVAEPVLSRLQDGAISYAREYAKAIELFAPAAEARRALANTALQRLVFFPDRREVEFWQSVHHTNDIGGVLEIDEVLVTPRRPIWLRPWGWRRRARASMWTFGSIRYLLGVPGLLLYQLGWSRSKARRVQAPTNARRHNAPYYFSDETSRSPSRQPGKLDDSMTYLEAAARADAHVASSADAGVEPVTLLRPVMAAGTAAILRMNRLLPKRVYAGFEIVNDGIPVDVIADITVRRRASALTGRVREVLRVVRHPTVRHRSSSELHS